MATCRALSDALGSMVALPGSDIYRESVTSYLTALENELEPACIIKPASPSDVVAFRKAVKPMLDRGECQLAIQARGNQPFAGAANIAGGITADLHSLDDITINMTEHSVTLGVGVSWGDVYAKLHAAGLCVTGGRSSQGGIGGLSLGGNSESWAVYNVR